MTAFTTLLAHQGGWDEILLIAGPIIAIAGLLLLAKKRVDRLTETNPQPQQETASSGASPAPSGPDDGQHGASATQPQRSIDAPTERSRPTRSS